MAWIEGKRVLITGGTSGLGRAVATQLAGSGAEVVLTARDRFRGAEVAAAVDAEAGTDRTVAMELDVADQRSVREFARTYLARFGSVDVLVNNAAALLPTRALSVDGIELTFATNVLGYHLVTTELREGLLASDAARVVNVASTYAFGLDLDDLQFQRRDYDGLAAYAQSKACNRMLTWALARRLDGTRTTANAMAPGLVLDTELYRDLDQQTRDQLAQYGTRTIEEGADTIVWLASSPDVEGISGRLFEQRAELPCELRDEAAEERLWRRCEELTGRVHAAP